MDWIFTIAFLAILGKLAYDDAKTRLLRDLDLALLWLCLGLPAMLGERMVSDSALGIAGAGFVFIYMFLYALPIAVCRKPIIRLGDVLLFPAVLAFCFSMFGLPGAYLAAFGLGLALIISFKKSLPFATWMFLFTLGMVIFIVAEGFALLIAGLLVIFYVASPLGPD